MTEPQIPEGFTSERWVFLGEYEGSKYKRVAGFRDPSGEELLYKWDAANGRMSVGDYYSVWVQRADERRSIRGGFRWTGEKADDREEIRMQARLRDAQRENKLAEERSRKNDPELQALLDHVEQYAAKFTKISSRQALIPLIERAVWRAQRGRM